MAENAYKIQLTPAYPIFGQSGVTVSHLAVIHEPETATPYIGLFLRLVGGGNDFSDMMGTDPGRLRVLARYVDGTTNEMFIEEEDPLGGETIDANDVQWFYVALADDQLTDVPAALAADLEAMAVGGPTDLNTDTDADHRHTVLTSTALRSITYFWTDD